MSSGVVLTRPASSSTTSTGSSIVKLYGLTLPMNAQTVVDAIQYTNRASVKWLVTLVDSISLHIQSYEIAANYRAGDAEPTYVKYARIGKIIDNDVNVIVLADHVQLVIYNNEPHQIIADVLRFDLVV